MVAEERTASAPVSPLIRSAMASSRLVGVGADFSSSNMALEALNADGTFSISTLDRAFAISSFSGEVKSVNTFAGIENPAGTLTPDFTRSAIDAALLPTIAGSRAEGASSSTIKGAFWVVGIAVDFTLACERSVPKKSKNKGARMAPVRFVPCKGTLLCFGR